MAKETLLPGKASDVGHTAKDNRLFINRTGEPAVLSIACSGAPWRDLPERFVPLRRPGWNPVYRRSITGLWKNVFDVLQEPDLDGLLINSPFFGRISTQRVKKSNPVSVCLSQSAGGWSTEINALMVASGNPLRLILTVGQRADISQNKDLLTDYGTGAVLADRGYNAK